MKRAEFIAKYGEVEVTFDSYHKYTFIYAATLPDGKRLTVGIGGDSAEMYRQEVVSGRVERVSHLWPYTGAVHDGPERVEWFYEFFPAEWWCA